MSNQEHNNQSKLNEGQNEEIQFMKILEISNGVIIFAPSKSKKVSQSSNSLPKEGKKLKNPEHD